MKKRYLAAAYVLVAGYVVGLNLAVGIDKHHARTGTDLDLRDKRNMGGIYGPFDYKPTPAEQVLINKGP